MYPDNYLINVLSFNAKEDYVFEGISVLTEDSHKSKLTVDYDVIISHAPNLRNHVRFIILNFFKTKACIFIFHGYEAIDVMKRVYHQQTLSNYPVRPKLIFKIYNKIKLPILKISLKIIHALKKSHFIFVSNTLWREVISDMRAPELFILGKNTTIINNSINPIFKKNRYLPTSYSGDFVCIRPFEDPKYGVDIFIELAKNNPNYSFHLFGKGDLPRTELPRNLKIFTTYLRPEEIVTTFNSYRAAILPTRWDSQGLLACEAAVFGIPVISSKIPVCEEFLNNFQNVFLINNQVFHQLNLTEIFPKIQKDLSSNHLQDAISSEIALIQKIALQKTI